MKPLRGQQRPWVGSQEHERQTPRLWAHSRQDISPRQGRHEGETTRVPQPHSVLHTGRLRVSVQLHVLAQKDNTPEELRRQEPQEGVREREGTPGPSEKGGAWPAQAVEPVARPRGCAFKPHAGRRSDFRSFKNRKKKILESKMLPKWLKNKRMNRPVAVETPGSDENLPSSDSPRANTPVPSSSAGSWAPARRYRHPAGSGSREETACPEPDCAESTKETM